MGYRETVPKGLVCVSPVVDDPNFARSPLAYRMLHLLDRVRIAVLTLRQPRVATDSFPRGIAAHGLPSLRDMHDGRVLHEWIGDDDAVLLRIEHRYEVTDDHVLFAGEPLHRGRVEQQPCTF